CNRGLPAVTRRHRHFSPALTTLSAAISLILGAVAADGLAQDVPDPAAPIEEITVTATRSTQRLSQLGHAVSVLDLEAIEREQAITLPELLIRTPGIHFTRPGGSGQDTTVRIRGAADDHTV